MNDELGDRMKVYEGVTRAFLTPRTNMIIRVDGRAFHTYTRGCKIPFDDDLMDAMDATAIAFCEEVQGAKLGYVQSDEITVWATSYDSLGTTAWFGGNVQKIVSIVASTATAVFNQVRWQQNVKRLVNASQVLSDIMGQPCSLIPQIAHFDARVWTIPEISEIANVFKWRADDASRNSVQMMARSLYSHKELEGKPLSDLHDLIYAKGQNWNDLAPRYKRGRLVKKIDGKWQICDLTDFTWLYWMEIVKTQLPPSTP